MLNPISHTTTSALAYIINVNKGSCHPQVGDGSGGLKENSHKKMGVQYKYVTVYLATMEILHVYLGSKFLLKSQSIWILFS